MEEPSCSSEEESEESATPVSQYLSLSTQGTHLLCNLTFQLGPSGTANTPSLTFNTLDPTPSNELLSFDGGYHIQSSVRKRYYRHPFQALTTVAIEHTWNQIQNEPSQTLRGAVVSLIILISKVHLKAMMENCKLILLLPRTGIVSLEVQYQ